MGNFWKSIVESYNSAAEKMNSGGTYVFRDYRDSQVSSLNKIEAIKVDFEKKMTCSIKKKWIDITYVYIAGDYVIYGDDSYLLFINSRLGTGDEKKREDCNIHIKREFAGNDLTFSLANTIATYHEMLKNRTIMANTIAKQEDKINSGLGLKSKYKVAVSIGNDGILFRDSNRVLTLEEVCVRINDNHSSMMKESGINNLRKQDHDYKNDSSNNKSDSRSVINTVIECPKCKQKLRIPASKRIQVNCNRCHHTFIIDNGIVKHAEKEEIKENTLNNLEKRFARAYEYLKNTSAEDIAVRTSIYGAYVNMYLHENFAHDYYLDIIAALCGPFKFNLLIDDKIIMKMLDDTKYGFVNVSDGWITPLRNWVLSNCGYKSDEYLRRIVSYLDQGKGDEILEHFNYITQVVQPDEYTYFPEMNPSINGHINSSTWPRI